MFECFESEFDERDIVVCLRTHLHVDTLHRHANGRGGDADTDTTARLPLGPVRLSWLVLVASECGEHRRTDARLAKVADVGRDDAAPGALLARGAGRAVRVGADSSEECARGDRHRRRAGAVADPRGHDGRGARAAELCAAA